MDINDINIIESNKELIIKDLHGDVFDSLKECGILTLEEYNDINALNKLQEEKNKRFLEILYRKPNGLKPFLDALEEWYDWIVKNIQQDLIPKWQKAVTHILALPPRNVSRNKLLLKVRTKLRGLKPGRYVVLHGMSGCGKSSLAAESLHDDLTVDIFKGNVIWLSCGKKDPDYANNPDDVVDLMMELNVWICNKELVKDVQATSSLVKRLNIKLRKRFEESKYKDGLLVLDDVNSHHVIAALNVGCKTLVTTFNTDVMKDYEGLCEFIPVDEGFTEEETLKHLSLSVGMRVKELPKQAKDIHFSGKGHPLVMSLIGAQLNSHPEEARNNNAALWKTFVEVLDKGQYENLNRRSLDGQPLLPTFELCLSRLNPDLKEKYLDFVIFVEDVNITVEVMATLWNEDVQLAKLIMQEFITKSLIVSKYNRITNDTVYGIHDLLLRSLRKELNSEELKERHKKLIRRYLERCHGDLSQLPKGDNYLLYYIGYHIHNSGEHHFFPEWYFNFHFIEAKLKIAGHSDLLSDYKRYGDKFSQSQFDVDTVNKKLKDFESFVKLSGADVRRNNGPDIIQLALQEPHDSEVYKAALRAAQSRTTNNYLYFQLSPSVSRSAPLTIQNKGEIVSACFSANHLDMIVGMKSGNIQMISHKGYVFGEYSEHDEPVTLFDVCPAKRVFLSASSKYIKVWPLPELDGKVVPESEESRTPSPSQRQSGYFDMFSSKQIERHRSLITWECRKPVTWACFSGDGSLVATCCSDRVEIWEVSLSAGKAPIRSIHFPATTCVFSHNSEDLIIGCETSYIYVYNLHMHKHHLWHKGSYPIRALFFVPGNVAGDPGSIGVLTQNKLTISPWHHHDSDSDDDKASKVPCMRDYNFGEDERYVRCTAACDGTFVAVATSTGKILICDLNDGRLIKPLDHSDGQIRYLSVDRSRDHRVMATYDDSTLRVWTLGQTVSHKQATMKPNFVTNWDWGGDSQLVLAAPTCTYVKKIYGKNEKSEDIPLAVADEVNVCGLSVCGKYMAISTSGGQVFLHHGDQAPFSVMSLDKCPKELKVAVAQHQIFVIAEVGTHIVIWTCKMDSIANVKTAKTFQIQVDSKHLLVKCFVLPDFNELITVDKIDCIKKWRLTTGEELGVLHTTRRVDVRICDADLSNNLTVVTLDDRGNFLNIYPLTGQMASPMSVQLKSTPTCCRFSTDSNRLVIGFSNGNIEMALMRDGTVTHLTSVCDGRERVESVRVSRDGCVWAATKTRLLLAPPGENVALGQARLRVKRLVLSPDDSTLVTMDSDGQLHFINDFKLNTYLGPLSRQPRPENTPAAEG